MGAGRYWIIGPGRLGLSVGTILVRAGEASELVLVGRGPEAPDHPLLDEPGVRYVPDPTRAPPSDAHLLLAVPDDAIADAASRIGRPERRPAGATALHFSGALSSEILAPLGRRGYAIGSLHPLATLADARAGPDRLRGAFFTFEGESAAQATAAGLVEAAAGRMLEVHAKDKVRYHAACVFASNYMVACASVAARLLGEAAEIPRERAVEALGPLWAGAIANLEATGLPRALTGPIARGDVEIVKRHLSVLGPRAGELYRRLGVETLDLAREMGLNDEVARAIAEAVGGGPAEG